MGSNNMNLYACDALSQGRTCIYTYLTTHPHLDTNMYITIHKCNTQDMHTMSSPLDYALKDYYRKF